MDGSKQLLRNLKEFIERADAGEHVEVSFRVQDSNAFAKVILKHRQGVVTAYIKATET